MPATIYGVFKSSLIDKFDWGRLDSSDIIDRLNYEYTTLLLVITSLTFMANEFIMGKPIQCYVPAEFTKFWESYAETYCFAKNTYLLPFEEDIPNEYGTRTTKEINYYQWIPFVIFFQALLFHTPSLIWTCMCRQSGINVKEIMKSADQVLLKLESGGKIKKSAECTARYIRECLHIQGDMSKWRKLSGFMLYGKSHGWYLTLMYLFTKLLYLLNSVGNALLINSFLGSQSFNPFATIDVFDAHEWKYTGIFPRITFCDFTIRNLGNLHRYTVQCVLRMNLFYQASYSLFWMWCCLLSILNLFGLLYWCYILLLSWQQQFFITKFIRILFKSELSEDFKKYQNLAIKRFLQDDIRPDGVFLLRLIRHNAGDFLVGHIISAMWTDYCAHARTQSGPKNTASVESIKQEQELGKLKDNKELHVKVENGTLNTVV